ncbi:pimeloyl-ACP methyl ester carboxylesterase [Massilia sp. UYP11]|uniref:alpha/beta fold hydrolase n=1 Tax=Massilia sp. UYP11 TaxID=1756385 RepID=UPI003D1A90CB
MTALKRTALLLQGRQIELEYEWITAQRADAPLIVFLHEGLGAAAVWGDWPTVLCRATGCRGLVYSRYGYGSSTPRPPGEPWPIDYLGHEAREALPALLDALGVDAARDQPILFGHSDGGSIALQYAAAFPQAVRAIVVVAAHLFTEEMGSGRIRWMQHRYANSALRSNLAAVHDCPDDVFRGWSELWLSERFRDWNIERCVPMIQCPVLAVQGAEDQYGTLDQLDQIARLARNATRVVLERCGHFPHSEQPAALAAAVKTFLEKEIS